MPWCRCFCMLQQHNVQCCCTNPLQKKRALSRAGLLNSHEVLTAHRMRTQSPLRSRQRLSGSGKQRNSWWWAREKPHAWAAAMSTSLRMATQSTPSRQEPTSQ